MTSLLSVALARNSVIDCSKVGFKNGLESRIFGTKLTTEIQAILFFPVMRPVSLLTSGWPRFSRIFRTFFSTFQPSTQAESDSALLWRAAAKHHRYQILYLENNQLLIESAHTEYFFGGKNTFDNDSSADLTQAEWAGVLRRGRFTRSSGVRQRTGRGRGNKGDFYVHSTILVYYLHIYWLCAIYYVYIHNIPLIDHILGHTEHYFIGMK